MYLGILLQTESGGLASLLPILAMVMVIYLFMLRPQMRRQKNERKFQTNITKGAKVITTSGIHGKIVELNNDGTVLIETGAGKIRFERTAISMDLTNKLNAPKKK